MEYSAESCKRLLCVLLDLPAALDVRAHLLRQDFE